MAATYPPQVVFDFPSGEDYSRRIRAAAGFGEHGQGTRTFTGDQEPSDELFQAIRSAIDQVTGGSVQGHVRIDHVAYQGARLEVTVQIDAGDA
jgi:hypothetical protein